MSKKNEFTSKYTSKKVSAAAFLCDFIMEKIAGRAGKTLPYKYWQSPDWSKQFKRQLVAASKLLEEVSLTHVMAFLRSKQAYSILSLGLKTQIVEGAKKFIVCYTSNEIEPIVVEADDLLIEDSFVDVSVIVSNKAKTEWEILNG